MLQASCGLPTGSGLACALLQVQSLELLFRATVVTLRGSNSIFECFTQTDSSCYLCFHKSKVNCQLPCRFCELYLPAADVLLAPPYYLVKIIGSAVPLVTLGPGHQVWSRSRFSNLRGLGLIVITASSFWKKVTHYALNSFGIQNPANSAYT